MTIRSAPKSAAQESIASVRADLRLGGDALGDTPCHSSQFFSRPAARASRASDSRRAPRSRPAPSGQPHSGRASATARAASRLSSQATRAREGSCRTGRRKAARSSAGRCAARFRHPVGGRGSQAPRVGLAEDDDVAAVREAYQRLRLVGVLRDRLERVHAGLPARRPNVPALVAALPSAGPAASAYSASEAAAPDRTNSVGAGTIPSARRPRDGSRLARKPQRVVEARIERRSRSRWTRRLRYVMEFSLTVSKRPGRFRRRPVR